MKNHLRWYGIATIGLLVAGALLYPRRSPKPQAVPRCQFQVGEELALALRTEVQTEQAGSSSAVRETGLLLRVLAQEANDSWTLAAILSSVKRGTKPLPAGSVESKAEDVPFLVKVGDDCRFADFAFLPSVSAPVRLHLQDTLQSYEVLMPRGAFRDGWVRSHRDAMGSFNAFYFLQGVDADGHLQISRRRGPYVGAEMVGQTGKVSIDLSDERAEALLDSNGRWLRRFEARYRRVVSAVQSADSWREAFSIHAVLTRDDSLLPFPLEEAKLRRDLFAWGRVSAQDVMAGQVSPAPSEPDSVTTAPAVQRTLPELAQTLESIFAGSSSAGLNEARRQLIAYLRQHPEKLDEVLAQLHRRQYSSKTASVILYAMARSGTPESHAALQRAVADPSMPELHRTQAASALADVPKPNQATLQSLQDAVSQRRQFGDNIANVAANALGQIAFEHQESDPQIADQARQLLRTELKAASSPIEQGSALTAIGNSGSLSMLDDVKPFLQSEDASVRAAAATSLRRMPFESVEPLLRQRLAADPDPMTRRFAATAMIESANEHHKPPSAESIKSAAERLPIEESLAMRTNLINLLGLASATNPAAKQALIAYFRQEKEPDLLALIGRYCSAAELK